MSSISSTSGSNSEIADQYSTQQAEKEKLRAEHEVEMDRLNKTYTAEKESQKDRFETSIQNQKNQTYENLRTSKKQFTAAEKNLKTSGDERLHQKAEEYRQDENRITKEGTAHVEDALKKQAAIEEYQRNQANQADTSARFNLSHNAQAIIKDSEDKIAALQQSKMDTLEKRKEEHGVAVEQIRAHYDQRQSRLMDEHEKETQNIQDGVNKQINDSKLSNATRLKVHMDKQEDPFYRMSKIDSDFSDHEDFYQLKIRLPEYERKGFRVQISGNELRFSGMRTSSESATVEPGHDASTNSYQSFSEKYLFDTPVDAKAMQASQDGDWLYYIIPKYGPNHLMREQNAHSKISKLDLEMSNDLDFKETLPLPKYVKDHGSGTYS